MDIFASKFYEIKYGSRDHNGILLFFRLLIIRCFLASMCIGGLLFLVLKYLNADALLINILVGTIAVFIEEQARWIYANYSNNVKRSQIQFALMALLVESIGYYKPEISLLLYFFYRLGSFFVHTLNGLLCFISFHTNYRKRIAFFVTAIIFHLSMNMFGSSSIGEWLSQLFHVKNLFIE